MMVMPCEKYWEGARRIPPPAPGLQLTRLPRPRAAAANAEALRGTTPKLSRTLAALRMRAFREWLDRIWKQSRDLARYLSTRGRAAASSFDKRELADIWRPASQAGNSCSTTICPP